MTIIIHLTEPILAAESQNNNAAIVSTSTQASLPTTTTTTATTATDSNDKATNSDITQTSTSNTSSQVDKTTSSPQNNPITTTVATAELAATVREPTEQEINEARKIIQEVASTIKETNPHRLIMNKPLPSSLQADYPPDSAEARISDATSHFGLNLLRANSKLAAGPAARQENTVISPLSLQILMNIVLLGTKDQSLSQLELAKALGYENDQTMMQMKRKSNSTTGGVTNEEESLSRLHRPHEALNSVVDSIMKSIHLSVEDRHLQQLLLNTNAATIPSGLKHQLEAHLQTTNRDNDTPLSDQLNFTLANLMMSNKDLVKTSAEYEKELKKFYNVKVEQFSRELQQQHNKNSSTLLNSAIQPERALHDRVNEWVKNITSNQITDLVDESTLNDPLLLLVLINAAHFKGQWLHTFNTRLTEERTFYNFGSEPKDTRFMRQNGVFGYAEFKSMSPKVSNSRRRRHSPANNFEASDEDVRMGDGSETTIIDYSTTNENEKVPKPTISLNVNCSALLLPFSLNDGQEMSMVVILPNKRDGLDELMENLDVQTLNEIYRALGDTQQVQVELPKFSLQSAHDVRSLLEKLGVQRIFSRDSAELDRMFGSKSPAFVGKVIHKSKINVDEQGAEAAAASLASVVMRSSIRVTIPSFIADHPFFYVIRYNRSNMPLFMGQVRSF